MTGVQTCALPISLAQLREALAVNDLALDDTAAPPDYDLLVKRVFHFLSSAKSAVFILNQEEITGEEHQQNLPGSTAEYPNWRRKMIVSIEQLGSLRSLTEWMRTELEKSGRH